MAKTCEICGKASGNYILCFDCNKKKRDTGNLEDYLDFEIIMIKEKYRDK